MTDAEREAQIRERWEAGFLQGVRDEQPFLLHLLDEARAEIVRRETALTRDHGHNEPCLICGKPCNSLAGNPGLWALRLGNNGWHHAKCVNAALSDLARRIERETAYWKSHPGEEIARLRAEVVRLTSDRDEEISRRRHAEGRIEQAEREGRDAGLKEAAQFLRDMDAGSRMARAAQLQQPERRAAPRGTVE